MKKGKKGIKINDTRLAEAILWMNNNYVHLMQERDKALAEVERLKKDNAELQRIINDYL